MMLQEAQTCRARRAASKDVDVSCLGDYAYEEAAKSKLDFYAISGYTYAVDFVRWWAALQSLDTAAGNAASALLAAFPRPSLTELQGAADLMCASPWDTIAAPMADKATQHQYT